MAMRRVALISLFFLAIATVANAVSFTPSFERDLREHLATIKADTTAYPMEITMMMVPKDVDGWTQKSLESCNLTLESLEAKLNSSLLRDLAIIDPAEAGNVHKFINDVTAFVAFFYAGIQSGDVSPAPTSKRPAIKAPPRPTAARSSDGSGSKEAPSEITWKSYTYTYTPYTDRPVYSPPTPQYTSSGESSQCSFRWVKFVLVVIAAIVCIGKWLDSYSDKQQKKEEEGAAAAAALRTEAVASSQATYVAVLEEPRTAQKL